MSKRISDILFIFSFWLFIAVFGICIWVFPGDDISYRENRRKAEMPELEIKSIINGDFFKELGNYYSDRLPLKERLVSLCSISELAMGKRESNGVILASNETLVTLPDHSDAERVKSNISAIEELCAERDNALFFSVPHPSSVFSALLPKGLEAASSISSLLGEKGAEVSQAFLRSATYGDFYRTDHHWTTDGAYKAYTQICERFSITPEPIDTFSREIISESFWGTSFARSGLPYSLISPDSITLYRYDGDERFDIYNYDTDTIAQSFYKLGALEGSDKYTVFLGGNYSRLSIKKQSESNRPTLLLIKDSYANSLIPFLAIHFDMEVVDPRYCAPSQITEICSSESLDGFDNILILLGEDTLASEGSIELIGKS